MDIHKPKPWHGLREFLKEYLIIVVGVLTALAAEGVVQVVDWQRRVADAEADMRSELTDNARFAYERIAAYPCATAQFRAIRVALAANRDAGTPIPPMARYKFLNRAWLTDTWENAHSLQLTGHLSTERLRQYSRAFYMADRFRTQQHEMLALIPAVDSLATNGGRISPAERDRLFVAVEALEETSNNADNLAERFRESAQKLGVDISPEQKARALTLVRRLMGDCATDPDVFMKQMLGGQFHSAFDQHDTGYLMNRRAGP